MFQTKFTKNRTTKAVTVLLVCLLALVIALVVASHHNRLAAAFSNATTHAPETFTELFFTNYQALPKTIVAAKTYSVPFTVTNHEAKTFSYVYQAEVIEHGTDHFQKPVALTLDNGQSAHESVKFSAQRHGDQVEVVIRLLHKNLSIHYKAQA